MNLDDGDERSALAGEYVLGTLDDATRPEFERALASDAGLRAEVAAWQDRLLGLAHRVAPAEPSQGVWARIESGLRPKTSPSASPSIDPAPAGVRSAGPSPARPAARPPAPKPDTRWWHRVGVWQGASAFAVAVAVLLATLLVVRPPPPADAVQYLALLQAPETTRTGWIVEGRSGGVLKLVPIGPGEPVPPGRSLQFWTKPEGAAGPTSLGLVAAGTTTTLPVSQLPGLGEKQLFEITLEPEGGSTVGRPTGPILFVGRALRL